MGCAPGEVSGVWAHHPAAIADGQIAAPLGLMIAAGRTVAFVRKDRAKGDAPRGRCFHRASIRLSGRYWARVAVSIPRKTGSLKITCDRPSQATSLQEENIFFEVRRKSTPTDTTLFKPPISAVFDLPLTYRVRAVAMAGKTMTAPRTVRVSRIRGRSFSRRDGGRSEVRGEANARTTHARE